LRDSSDNSIYHNSFIDNTNHIDVLRSKNAWNATWPSGGNHWSNYTGVDEKSGPNQDQPGSDGIGDTPHNITAEERDYYPRLLTVHNVDTGLDYCWIQKAIDADETIDGHTIKVDVSICYENVKVYKSLMLQGENRTTTIIDGGGAGTVLYISASNVSISNFTIRNGRYGIHLDGSGDTVLRNNNMTNNKYNFFVDGTELSHFINDVDGSNWVDGKRIYYLINNQSLVIDISTHPDLGYLGLVNCKNITAQNLNLTGNGQGLLLAFTNGSTITHVNASNNDYGIYLFGCSGDTITGSNIVNNDGDGVNLFGSSENTIASNKIANNHWGVSLEDSNSTNVADNHITESYSGIHASGSGNNVTGNNVTRMLFCGIQLSGSNNSVTNNNVTNNRDGILLIFSLGNNVTCNNITSNSNFGIWLESSSGNTISGNDVINNSYGIYLSLSPGNRIFHNYFFNIIKDTLMAEPGQMNYWHDGYPSGGNYWHFFAPSAEDEKRGAKGFAGVPQPSPGSDGINDTSYYIDSLNVDWYPLMKPYGGLHDIGIRSINLSKTCYIANYSLAINITVINYAGGFYNETINIIVQARNATDHTIPIGSTTFNLTYRNSRIINFTWNTADQKNGTYTIEAILTRVPGETCFEDNTKQTSYVVSIRGDINGDRKVDGKDVALTIKHYGSYPGHPKYNPNVDINCDGKIDGKDVALTIKHYGQHW
jgi:parallel beta-helix repeat protein